MRTKIRPAALVVATAVLTATAACGGGAGSAATGGPLSIDGVQIADAGLYTAAQNDGSVTLYTGLHADTEQAIAKAFTQDTGIPVSIVAAKPDALVERAVSEFGAKNVSADAISVSSLAYVQELDKAHAVEGYCTPFNDKYAKALTDPACTYFPRSENYITMSVNTAVLQQKGLPTPTDWKDLQDPRWKGLVGASQIGVGGSSWSFWKLMRDTYGVQFWNTMAGQKMLLTGSAAATGDALERGEIAVAIESPATPYEQIAQGAPISVLTPSVVPIYDNYMSLAAGGPHPNAGKLFVAWIASPPGQAAISKVGGGDYPAADGAPGPVVSGKQLPGITGLKAKTVAMEADPTYVSEFTAWTKEWDSIFNYS